MTIATEVDLKVGGKYRIAMTDADADGKTHPAVGQFKVIDEPNKRVYSWNWEGSEDPGTTVTVQFRPNGSQTEVTLTHENFPNSEMTSHHSQGWTGIFARLVAFC
jgi:uncharacterized protein YndB with AHSA1/START domain